MKGNHEFGTLVGSFLCSLEHTQRHRPQPLLADECVDRQAPGLAMPPPSPLLTSTDLYKPASQESQPRCSAVQGSVARAGLSFLPIACMVHKEDAGGRECALRPGLCFRASCPGQKSVSHSAHLEVSIGGGGVGFCLGFSCPGRCQLCPPRAMCPFQSRPLGNPKKQALHHRQLTTVAVPRFCLACRGS